MNNIAHYRRKAGLTQEGLGLALKPVKHKTTISNYETGRRKLLAEDAIEITDVLISKGVKIDIRDLYKTKKKAA